MNVSLSAEMKNFINVQIESGLYSSASEVVSEGLRLLEDVRRRRLIDEINLKIDRGLADVSAGRVYTPEELRARLAKRRAKYK